MTLPLSAVCMVISQFVNENIIPFLDKNNPNFALCLQKWKDMMENVMKKISNFKTEEDLREKVELISKMNRKQKQDKKHEQKPQKSQHERSSAHIRFEESQKLIKKSQQSHLKHQQLQKQETIQFRDRKTSLDQHSNRKQKREEIQTASQNRKEQRSNSFNGGLQNDIVVQIPLILSPNTQMNEKRNSFGAGNNQKKQNEITSFHSISEFHQSRKSIPSGAKEIREEIMQNQQQQLKMKSKKSIEDYPNSTLAQNKPNSYSTNYIESIKKIKLQSPSQKVKPLSAIYSESQTSQPQQEGQIREIEPRNIVVTRPHRESEVSPKKQALSSIQTPSALTMIKKRTSETSQVINSPQPKLMQPLGSSESFSKFMNSFKKLCNTFESNHQKLLREDFNNKYINC